MDEREKALYQATLAQTIPDLRNELEHYSLPTTGTIQTTATGERICIQNHVKTSILPCFKNIILFTLRPFLIYTHI